jgi:ABC-2 type transport system ATP-binding protein
MLTVNDITFSYRRKGQPVLKDFSLTVNAGGVYGLLGRNGVGKSTLLYLIAGALTPRKGEVLFKGFNTRLRLPETMADIFIVPEELYLPSIKLKEYVKANAPLYPSFSAEDMARNLETFGMTADVNLGRLSMGQKKKVFMSFALACNTSLLLMDEPTNGLDIPGKEAFRSFIAGSMTDERAIIISTHQVRDIDRLLDHVIIMDDTRVLLDSSMTGIAARLKFTTTNNPAVATEALLARPSIWGTEIVTPNDDGVETDVDIEMLFTLATTRPDETRRIFSTQNEKL